MDDRDSDSESRVMLTTPAKLPARDTQQPSPPASPEDQANVLGKGIRGALEGFLNGRRLAKVQIRHVEGSKTEGFLKIEGGRGDRLLVDFRATSTPQGELSALWVGGNKISLIAGAPTKRVRQSRGFDC